MNCLFVLSGEAVDFGRAEVSHLFGVSVSGKGKILEATIQNRHFCFVDRLAYTTSVHEILFVASLSQLKDQLEKFSWKNHIKGSFCVRVEGGVGLAEKTLAGFIWRSLSRPKVDLEHPGTKITFFFYKRKIFGCRTIWENHEDFEKRKAHKRVVLSPTSLHPKLARCLINFSGVTRGTVVDPFCGTGGILIEGGLMGLKMEGYDLYDVMVDRAQKNLKAFGFSGTHVTVQDALLLKKQFDCIVTDVPYGMNTSLWRSEEGATQRIALKKEDDKKRIRMLRKFYLSFLMRLKRLLTQKGVLVFPHYAQASGLLRKAGFSILWKGRQYIHRSLQREVFIVIPRRDGS